jgi:uncharacterized OB-fold protein
MTSASYAKPLPKPDPLSAPYWEHAWNHRLSIQRCSHCGDRHFPPSDVCPACLSGEQEWEVVSGRATLVSWVRFHRAYWDGYRAPGETPYDVCLARLEEGPLVLSNFAQGIPENARMGMPLKAVFDDVAEGVSLVRFQPA